MSQKHLPFSDPVVRRAVWPEVMFASDVALALSLKSASAARRVMRSGRIGPYLQVGRRLAVRRESVLAALRAAERRTGGGA